MIGENQASWMYSGLSGGEEMAVAGVEALFVGCLVARFKRPEIATQQN
ncbi:MAG: hypothetical protein K2H84_07090 [Paramuribaculum sp.]|nr:hypothetical protein [Paramuribaculum sp.]